MPKTTYLHEKYRPDIDGLRGFAILSVVIFHIFPGGLRGGFIGVEIYKDVGHLSADFVRSYASFIDASILGSSNASAR